MVKDLLRLNEVAHFDLFDDGLQGEATLTAQMRLKARQALAARQRPKARQAWTARGRPRANLRRQGSTW